jgi:hypothetical protein
MYAMDLDVNRAPLFSKAGLSNMVDLDMAVRLVHAIPLATALLLHNKLVSG